jgi:hypothetical protein
MLTRTYDTFSHELFIYEDETRLGWQTVLRATYSYKNPDTQPIRYLM